VQNSFFDKVPVDKVKDFQKKLVETLQLRHENILTSIRDKAMIDDATAAELKSAVGTFAETYQP